MLALPIPLISALILTFLGLRAALEGETPKMVLGLIALCAGQSLLISLNQYYGLSVVAPLQPVTATVIPVLTYLTFLSTAVRPLKVLPDALHALAPLAAAICTLLESELLDVVLVVGFAGYGVLLLSRLRAGADGLPLVRLDNDNRALLLWRWMAIALISSAASDLMITVLFLTGQGWLRPWLVSLYASLFLLLIGLLNLSEVLKGRPTDPEDRMEERSDEHSKDPPGDRPLGAAPPALHDQMSGSETPQTIAADVAGDDAPIMARVRSLMEQAAPYLDPNLSLRQMARRLSLPEKQLSAAINRATGENVSRFINAHRIEHACGLMRAGMPITSAIYASGFNTKSNFNREFLRVKGCAPSQWLEASDETGAPAEA